MSVLRNGSFEHPLYTDGTPLPGVINPNDGSPRVVNVPPDGDNPIYVLDSLATAIDAWEVFAIEGDGTVDWIHESHFASTDGERSIDLNGTPGRGGIKQTFDTEPGREYEVRFDMGANSFGNLADPLADFTKELEVRAAEQSETFQVSLVGDEDPLAAPTDIPWEQKVWTFVATDMETTLEFLSLTPRYSSSVLDDYGPTLDNVAAFEGNYSADFDEDGDVDGADFMEWQRQFGTAGIAAFCGADATGDGNVDAADLAAWQSHFGSSTALSTMVTVPEPTTILLSMFGLAGFGWFRKKS